MINYELKSTLLKNGVYKDYISIKKLLYKNEIDIFNFYEYLEALGEENAKECTRIQNSSQSRVKRLKMRIALMLATGQCKFITLTFSPKTLQDTNEQTRRDYVRRWLSENSLYYIANVDYGKKNEREHYHAVALVSQDIEAKWKYGYIGITTCYTKNKSETRLAKYVSKLTNHAIKETAKGNRFLYPKGKKKNLERKKTNDFKK